MSNRSSITTNDLNSYATIVYDDCIFVLHTTRSYLLNIGEVLIYIVLCHVLKILILSYNSFNDQCTFEM